MTATYSDLKGKTVIITGASAGIGATTAKYFAAHNCKLVQGGSLIRYKMMSSQVSSGGSQCDCT